MSLSNRINVRGGGTTAKFLYKKGVDNVALTGGLTSAGWVLNPSYANDNNVTFRDEYIEMWVTDAYTHYSVVGTSVKVNLSKYKSCVVNYRWSDNSKHTVAMDLTNVTQEGYIGLAVVRVNTTNKASLFLYAAPTKSFENLYAYAITGTGSPMVSVDSRQIFVDEIILT